MSQPSVSSYCDRLRRHYAPLVAQHGDSHRAVDWGSAQSQQKRFHVLLEAADHRHARILDVGCGVGHLVDHLQAHDFAGRYLGIDLVPEMTAAAARRHPGWEFRTVTAIGEAVDFAPDLVVASGLFTFADETMLQDTVCALFATTRRAVAFNSLSNWMGGGEPGEFHADPVRVLEFCRTLTPRVVLRHDYLPHDFTIYLYRGEAP